MKLIIGVENARIQFTMEADAAPDLIKLKSGTLLSKIGRYASPGDQYCYRAVAITEFDGEVSEWPEYSGLKG